MFYSHNGVIFVEEPMGSRNILQKLNSEDPRVVSSISENQL
jgi:hypothetical protein